jgi:flagellar biosynthesis/type III secretory pathway protein FliH
MSTSITIQQLDAATANWLCAEAQRLNQSVEALILAIIQKEINTAQKAALRQTRAQQIERQYATAYARFPVQPDEYEIDESQLAWGEE